MDASLVVICMGGFRILEVGRCPQTFRIFSNIKLRFLRGLVRATKVVEDIVRLREDFDPVIDGVGDEDDEWLRPFEVLQERERRGDFLVITRRCAAASELVEEAILCME